MWSFVLRLEAAELGLVHAYEKALSLCVRQVVAVEGRVGLCEAAELLFTD